MKIKNLLISLLSFTLLFSPLFVKNIYADSVTLSGIVQNASGVAISGATVAVNDPNSDNTTTNSSGQYSLTIPSGTYNVTVTPPSGSGYASAIACNENVSSNTTLNFVLTPSGTVILNGTVTDPLGNPLPGQIVTFGSTSSTTNSSGQYSISVAPATKTLTVSNQNSSNNQSSFKIPQQYTMTDSSYALTQDTILNIQIPMFS